MSVEVPQNSQLVPDGNLTVDPVPQKKSNLPLVLLSLLVLVLVGSGGLILAKHLYTPKTEAPVLSQPSVAATTPTKSPFGSVADVPSVSTPAAETANWKTYNNSKYGYSFRYPIDFKITETSLDRVWVSNNLSPNPSCKGGGCNLGTVRLTIYFEHINNPVEDSMTLDDYASIRRTSLLQINNDQSQLSKMQKFGRDVMYMDGTAEGYQQGYFMKISPNKSFAITVSFPSKEDVPTYKEAADQILSTFKFL